MRTSCSIIECETRQLQVLTMSVLLPVRWGRVGWGIFSVCVVQVATLPAAEPVRFGRDVLPILSANCYACHGPDANDRKANLRLDVEGDAKAAHDDGVPVVPGQVEASTLIARIISTDPDQVMPPPDSHKTLKPEQIETLKRWVAEGGTWGRHWSFEPIVRGKYDLDGGQTVIDLLIQTELRKKSLQLREPAAPHQLVRRAYLDLIGVPPTIEEADGFAANPSDAAWEKLIDDLLSRPEFGEQWARVWMDLARYADTKGYEKDLGRTMWPYRDWLIRSINADMPLDQMTVEQLAGDLLPNATTDQLIATAFHRNTMSNDEGGTDDEEFRTIAVKDRVDTTLQVWMGLTAGCAKCHSHKYDSISQADYYSLYAIFNQTQDADRYDDFPTLEIPSAEQSEQRKALTAKIADLNAQLKVAKAADAQRDDQRWQIPAPVELTTKNGARLLAQPDGSLLASGDSPAEEVYTLKLTLKPGKHTVLRLQAFSEVGNEYAGVGRNPRDPNFVLSEIEAELTTAAGPKKLVLTNPRADFEQGGWPVKNSLDGDTKTGWAISPRQKDDHVALFDFAEPLTLEAESTITITLRQHYGDSLTLRRFRISTIGDDPASIKLEQPSSEETRKLNDAVAAATRELDAVNAAIPKTPVLRAVATEQSRETKIHKRGNFLDPGDVVSARLPEGLQFVAATSGESALTPGHSPGVDRLVFAKWLTARENPLTARVWANRIWARLFGIGIVETEEDFGALGTPPTHPELLDWLAAEYRDNGWSLKKLIKTIAMSRAYRQSSEITPELREADPRNQLISRGSRYRLPAETIRDQSLAAAGLLSNKMGGPPVMPPQPDGLWRSTYNGQKWVNAEGADRYRRGLYTYLKRTTPYPSLTTFDGGSGEVCQIRRIRTNTPLQALVTLNDPVYLEAAGALAVRMLQQKDHRTEYGLRLALIRPLRAGEAQPLQRLQKEVCETLQSDRERATSLIQSTRAAKPEGVSEAEFASWIVVANTILNLDEFLTRN